VQSTVNAPKWAGGHNASMVASTTADGATSASAARWWLLAGVLVVLPVANAHIGVPYVEARIPGDDDAWLLHRSALLAGHVVLVAVVVGWARVTGNSLMASRHLMAGVAAVGICFVLAAVAVAQKPLTPLMDASDLGSFSRTAQALSVASVVWAGVGQEVLFRVFAIPRVEEAAGSAVAAVLVTAAAFAYYHGGFSFGIANLLANFAGGLVLGAVFVRTRNLWAVAVPHAVLVAVLLAVA